MEEPIINRVAKSPLITLDLEDYFPEGERVLFDLKDLLFQGMILREKDLRDFVKEHDWSQYEGKYVAITCSEEVIVPTWAYMLVATRLSKYAADVILGDLAQLEDTIYTKAIDAINIKEFDDKMVVVKGCSKKDVPESVYVEITRRLSPVVRSLMFGEACSTVPLLKKKKKA
ncbi:DUF2480 family protein [Sediminitomix flava]|uniref:Uncharacterized protein DUF2480 n=1 Tax=Sediminitomix flava TaxID=379075 RepID=A0A315ZY86_SEDFL|nr:DUF2480 family protein [Sediminitomix flava]PWJ42317.1 uncharacterized protein DUF2480 [Sediminitomix flava]